MAYFEDLAAAHGDTKGFKRPSREQISERFERHVTHYNMSRGAPKPASAGRSKPASVVMIRIPHSLDPMQLSVELSALN